MLERILNLLTFSVRECHLKPFVSSKCPYTLCNTVVIINLKTQMQYLRWRVVVCDLVFCQINISSERQLLKIWRKETVLSTFSQHTLFGISCHPVLHCALAELWLWYYGTYTYIDKRYLVRNNCVRIWKKGP